MNRRGFLRACAGALSAGMLGLELALASPEEAVAVEPSPYFYNGVRWYRDGDELPPFDSILMDLYLPEVADAYLPR